MTTRCRSSRSATWSTTAPLAPVDAARLSVRERGAPRRRRRRRRWGDRPASRASGARRGPRALAGPGSHVAVRRRCRLSEIASDRRSRMPSVNATNVWSAPEGERVARVLLTQSERRVGARFDQLARLRATQRGREVPCQCVLEAPGVRVERAVERGDHRVGREHAHELAQLVRAPRWGRRAGRRANAG